MNRFARSFGGLCFAMLAVLSGCVPGKVIDSARNQADTAALEPGSYWAVQTDTGMNLFQMPPCRGESGKWLSAPDVPEWFTQEGLYSHDAAANWKLEMTGDETDLDSLLQVWDPPPCAG